MTGRASGSWPRVAPADARTSQPAVTVHRSNYILVFSYNHSPNEDPWLALEPPRALVKPEVAFQLRGTELGGRRPGSAARTSPRVELALFHRRMST